MRVEAVLRSVALADVTGTAAALEEAGVDTVCDAEVRRDPLLTLMQAATATSRIELATAVTIAFPRSPMVLASAARTLADYSGHRFRLGLGTQVRRHVEERFGAQWESPGPRLRDYVDSLRAIWHAWETGGPLDHRGRFYAFSLMTPEFDPGPTGHGPIPVDIAAVNPYNLLLAGETCDGVRLHRFCTADYMRDVIAPELRRGAERSSRPLEELRVTGGGFVATGVTDEEVRREREWVRSRVAFYGSTRAYLPVLRHHGWEALQEELRVLVRQERWSELAGVVDDEVLDAFCVAAPYSEIAGALADRFAGTGVHAVQMSAPDLRSADWTEFGRACARIHEVDAGALPG